MSLCVIALFFLTGGGRASEQKENPSTEKSPAVVANLSPWNVTLLLQGTSSKEIFKVTLSPRAVLPLELSETCSISAISQIGVEPSSQPLQKRLAPFGLAVISSQGGNLRGTLRVETILPDDDPDPVSALLVRDGQSQEEADGARQSPGGYRALRWNGGHDSFRQAVAISVKILVDDEEPASQRVWEARLRNRIALANEVLAQFFSLRLNVVAVHTWQSDDKLATLEEGYQQFVNAVDPAPATLAIGFASQWTDLKSPAPLGTCAGPLSRHILLREHGPAITETERLEMLLHEVGHILGAVHVTDAHSIMRPQLTDRRARDRQFVLGFDPLNTLIVNTVIKELAQGKQRFEEFSHASRAGLLFYYRSLVRANLSDETASVLANYLERLAEEEEYHLAQAGKRPAGGGEPLDSNDSTSSSASEPKDLVPGLPSKGEAEMVPPEAPAPAASSGRAAERGADIGNTAGGIQSSGTSPPPLAFSPRQQTRQPADSAGKPPALPAEVDSRVAAARGVIQTVLAEWEGNAVQAEKGRPVGDVVMEAIVKRAATASLRLGEPLRQREAFLLAIGILVDDSTYVRDQPGIGALWQRLESEAERRQRLARIPLPTIQNRHDWAQHFGVSAALTELLGPGPARSLGLAKEWRDAQGDSGFSFTDLAANYAGIAFAEAMQKKKISLNYVASSFRLDDYVPAIAHYDEGIPFERLIADYGGLLGARARGVIRDIEEAIRKLPAYSGDQ